MMNRLLAAIGLVLSIIVLTLRTTASFADVSGEDVIRKVRETFESLESFRAKFTQTFEWQLVGETQTVSGTITAMKGDKYRIETEDQTVVTDGKTVWNYSKANDQVTIDTLDKSADAPLMRDLFARYTERYVPKLAGIEVIRDSECYVVSLAAKGEEFIGEVTLWVERKSWLPLRIRQSDINQNVNVYEISEIQMNPEISPAIFRFEAPNSAEVIDLRY